MSFIASLAAAIGSAATTGLVGLGVGAGTAATVGGIAGGIGAGALTGSALGAGTAALTGQDVGEGAGMGALTGAVTGGLSSGLSAAGGVADAASAVNASTTGSGITTGPVSNVDKAFAGMSSPAANIQATASPLSTTQATAPSIGGATVPNVSPEVNNLGALGSAGQAWNNLSPTGQMIGQGILGMGVNSALSSAMTPTATPMPKPEERQSQFKWGGPNYTYSPATYTPYTPQPNVYKPTYFAEGGITDLDSYGSQAQEAASGGIMQIPNLVDTGYSGEYGRESVQMMAQGGIADLGGYATGGRPNLLHGAGDGVSDDIPASIAGKQPARLAAGEYVVPSRIVSELGNGSTDAGAQRLDEMVSRIQAGRKKTIGNNKQFANDSKAYKHLPA